MTTAETVELESVFMSRATRAAARGDKVAATVWSCAAQLLNAAEQDAISAAFQRSMDRRPRSLKIGNLKSSI